MMNRDLNRRFDTTGNKPKPINIVISEDIGKKTAKKYKKATVEVEAVQYTESNKKDVYDWVIINKHIFKDDSTNESILSILSPLGFVDVHYGDYVTKEKHNTFNRYTEDEFKWLFKPVNVNDTLTLVDVL